jgi:1,4-dihydroxy-6-naphthoate synthase
VLFSAIENDVLSGKYDLGLIIHESRFTYRQKGLSMVMDLGSYWENETGCPIPLGGIAVHRHVPHPVQKAIDSLIRKSLEYARQNYPSLSPFVVEHAQEMEEPVMRDHIDLYVNDFSLDLGNEGKAAVRKMLSLLPECRSVNTADLFV